MGGGGPGGGGSKTYAVGGLKYINRLGKDEDEDTGIKRESGQVMACGKHTLCKSLIYIVYNLRALTYVLSYITCILHSLAGIQSQHSLHTFQSITHS